MFSEYRDLFRQNINFRRLFWSRMVSLFGDWFHLLAILALLRQMGVHSAGAFGWVLILKSFPGALVSPVAGMAADRWSRRNIMMISDVVRAGLAFGILAQSFWPSVSALYVLIALASAVSAFFEPARTALLPDLVSKEELTTANAIGAATWSGMLTLGSAIGGVWTAFFGWESALLVDGLSFLVSFWFLSKLEGPEQANTQSLRGGDWQAWLGLRDISAGFVYMMERPRVWSFALVKSGWLLALPSPLLLAVLGERSFSVASMPILAVTVLYVARGLGTGSGPFLARELSKNRPVLMEKMIFFGFFCGAVFYSILPFSFGLWGAAICVILAHLGGATIWVFSTIRLQQIVPSQWRGRVFSTELSAFTLTGVLSTWSFSTMIDTNALSPFGLVWLSGLVMLGVTALWGFRGWFLGWAKE